jgi:hypothetical protein
MMYVLSHRFNGHDTKRRRRMNARLSFVVVSFLWLGVGATSA